MKIRQGQKKRFLLVSCFFLYENLFFNGMAKNHNFRGAKRKILMKNLFFNGNLFFLMDFR